MTLVELLTAMMVSVILIGTAFSTFWTATQAWEKSKRRSEMIRLIEGTADILTRHLRAVHKPFFDINPAFVAINNGDEERDYDLVVFLSSANVRFPRELALSDLCEIEFYIETGERGELEGEVAVSTQNERGLWMRIDPTPDDDVETGGYLVLLGEQFTSLDFRYFDGYEWLEEWFDETQVPEVIEFSLTISDPLERENPMNLTRLVVLPTATLVNDAAFAATEDLAGSEAGGETSPGATETPEQTGSGASPEP